jgi:hypothetical protein
MKFIDEQIAFIFFLSLNMTQLAMLIEHKALPGVGEWHCLFGFHCHSLLSRNDFYLKDCTVFLRISEQCVIIMIVYQHFIFNGKCTIYSYR